MESISSGNEIEKMYKKIEEESIDAITILYSIIEAFFKVRT